MANIFQQGPSTGQKKLEFFKRAGQLPPAEQTHLNLMKIAAEMGSSDPFKRADEFLKTDIPILRLLPMSSGIFAGDLINKMPYLKILAN